MAGAEDPISDSDQVFLGGLNHLYKELDAHALDVVHGLVDLDILQ